MSSNWKTPFKIKFCMCMSNTLFIYSILILITLYNVQAIISWLPKDYKLKRNPIIVSPDGPKNAAARTALVLFMHGINESAWAWSKRLESVREPFVKIICPRANEIPLEFYDGVESLAWYDKRKHHKEDIDGLQNMTKFLKALIEEEISKGIKPENIIVGGSEQGGTVAINAALGIRKRLGGIIVYNSWLPMRELFHQLDVEIHRNIPILQGHTKENPVVSLEQGEELSRYFKTITTNCTFKTYEPSNDTVPKECMDDIKTYLKQHLILKH